MLSKIVNSILILITISTCLSNCANIGGRRKSKISIEWEPQSDDGEVIFGDQAWTSPPIVEYNYDFEFESAVINGLLPNISSFVSNNTISNSELKSAPGCPEPFEGRPWVFYGKPKRCYLSGYQYPCPENMKLLPQRSTSYGFCACNCSSESYNGQSVTSPQSYCLGFTSEGKERILSYRKSWGRCYPLFEQGKCPENKWLVMSTESPLNGPLCKTRKCPAQTKNETLTFYDYDTKSCHNIGDRCNSSNVHLVGKETHYELTDGDWIPTCSLDISLRALSHRIGVSEIECGQGQRLSRILGSCIPLRRIGRGNSGGIAGLCSAVLQLNNNKHENIFWFQHYQHVNLRGL